MIRGLLITLIIYLATASCKSKKQTKHLDISAKSVAASKSQLDLLFSKITKVNQNSDTYVYAPMNEDKDVALFTTDSSLQVRNAIIYHNSTNTAAEERSAVKHNQKQEKKKQKDIEVMQKEEEEVQPSNGGYNKIVVLLLFIASIFILTRKS